MINNIELVSGDNRMIQLYIYMYVSMTFSLPIISFRNHAFSVVSKK